MRTIHPTNIINQSLLAGVPSVCAVRVYPRQTVTVTDSAVQSSQVKSPGLTLNLAVTL